MFLPYGPKTSVTFDQSAKCNLNGCNRFSKKKLSQLYLIHIIAQRVEGSRIKDCSYGSENVHSACTTSHGHDNEDVLDSNGVEHPLLKKNSMINMSTPFYYGNSTNDLLRDVGINQSQLPKSCYSTSSSTQLMSHRADLIRSNLVRDLQDPRDDLIPWKKNHETQCLNNICRVYQKNKMEKEKHEERFNKISAYNLGNKVQDILGLDESMETTGTIVPDLGSASKSSKSSKDSSQNEMAYATQVASSEWRATVSQQAPSVAISHMYVQPGAISGINLRGTGCKETGSCSVYSSTTSSSKNESAYNNESPKIAEKDRQSMEKNAPERSCSCELPTIIRTEKGFRIMSSKSSHCGGSSSVDIDIDYKTNQLDSENSEHAKKNIEAKVDKKQKLSTQSDINENSKRHGFQDERSKEKGATLDENSAPKSKYDNENDPHDSHKDRIQYKPSHNVKKHENEHGHANEKVSSNKQAKKSDLCEAKCNKFRAEWKERHENDNEMITSKNPSNVEQESDEAYPKTKLKRNDIDDNYYDTKKKDRMKTNMQKPNKTFDRIKNYSSSDEDEFSLKPEETAKRDVAHIKPSERRESAMAQKLKNTDDQEILEVKRTYDKTAPKTRHEKSKKCIVNEKSLPQKIKDMAKVIDTLEKISSGLSVLCTDENLDYVAEKKVRRRNHNNINNMKHNKEDMSKISHGKYQNKYIKREDTKDDMSKVSYRQDGNLYHTNLKKYRDEDVIRKHDVQKDDYPVSSEFESYENIKHYPEGFDTNRQVSLKNQKYDRHDHLDQSQSQIFRYNDSRKKSNKLEKYRTQEQDNFSHKKRKSLVEDIVRDNNKRLRSPDLSDHLLQNNKKISKNKDDEHYEESDEINYTHSRRNRKKKSENTEKHTILKEQSNEEYISDDDLEEYYKARESKDDKYASRNNSFEAKPISVEKPKAGPIKINKRKSEESRCLKSQEDDYDRKKSPNRRTETKQNINSHKRPRENTRTKSPVIEEGEIDSKQRRNKSEEGQEFESHNELVKRHSEKNRKSNFIPTKRKSFTEEDHTNSADSSFESHTLRIPERKKWPKERISKLDKGYIDNRKQMENNETFDEKVSFQKSVEKKSEQNKRNEKTMHRRENQSDIKQRHRFLDESDKQSVKDFTPNMKRKVYTTSKYSHNVNEAECNNTDKLEHIIRKPNKSAERNRSQDKEGRKSSSRLENDIGTESRKNRLDNYTEHIKNNHKRRKSDQNSKDINVYEESDFKQNMVYKNQDKLRNAKKTDFNEQRSQHRKSSPGTNKHKISRKYFDHKEEKSCKDNMVSSSDSIDSFHKTNKNSMKTYQRNKIEKNEQQEDWVDCDDDTKSDYGNSDLKRSDHTIMDSEQYSYYTWQDPYRTDLVKNIYHGAMHRLNPTIETVKVQTDKKRWKICSQPGNRNVERSWKTAGYKLKKYDEVCDKEESEESDCDDDDLSEKYIQKPAVMSSDQSEEKSADNICSNSDDVQFEKYNEMKNEIKREFEKECAKRREMAQKYQMKCQSECSDSDQSIDIHRAKITHNQNHKRKICVGGDKEKSIYLFKESSKRKSKKRHDKDDDDDVYYDDLPGNEDKNFRCCKDKVTKSCKPHDKDKGEDSGSKEACDDSDAQFNPDVPSCGYFFQRGVLYNDGIIEEKDVVYRNGRFRKGRRVLLEGITMENGMYYLDGKLVGEAMPDSYKKMQLTDREIPVRGYFLTNGDLYENGRIIEKGVKFKNGNFMKGKTKLLQDITLENGVFYQDGDPVGECEIGSYRKVHLSNTDKDIPARGYFFKKGILYKHGKIIEKDVKYKSGKFMKGKKKLLQGIKVKNGVFYQDGKPVGECEPGSYRKMHPRSEEKSITKRSSTGYMNPLLDPDISPRSCISEEKLIKKRPCKGYINPLVDPDISTQDSREGISDSIGGEMYSDDSGEIKIEDLDLEKHSNLSLSGSDQPDYSDNLSGDDLTSDNIADSDDEFKDGQQKLGDLMKAHIEENRRANLTEEERRLEDAAKERQEEIANLSQGGYSDEKLAQLLNAGLREPKDSEETKMHQKKVEKFMEELIKDKELREAARLEAIQQERIKQDQILQEKIAQENARFDLERRENLKNQKIKQEKLRWHNLTPKQRCKELKDRRIKELLEEKRLCLLDANRRCVLKSQLRKCQDYKKYVEKFSKKSKGKDMKKGKKAKKGKKKKQGKTSDFATQTDSEEETDKKGGGGGEKATRDSKENRNKETSDTSMTSETESENEKRAAGGKAKGASKENNSETSNTSNISPQTGSEDEKIGTAGHKKKKKKVASDSEESESDTTEKADSKKKTNKDIRCKDTLLYAVSSDYIAKDSGTDNDKTLLKLKKRSREKRKRKKNVDDVEKKKKIKGSEDSKNKLQKDKQKKDKESKKQKKPKSKNEKRKDISDTESSESSSESSESNAKDLSDKVSSSEGSSDESSSSASAKGKKKKGAKPGKKESKKSLKKKEEERIKAELKASKKEFKLPYEEAFEKRFKKEEIKRFKMATKPSCKDIRKREKAMMKLGKKSPKFQREKVGIMVKVNAPCHQCVMKKGRIMSKKKNKTWIGPLYSRRLCEIPPRKIDLALLEMEKKKK